MAASPNVMTPLCTTAPKATMESVADIDSAMETGDITPSVQTEIDCVQVNPMDSPSSNSGTLKARKYTPKNSPRTSSPRTSSPKMESPKVPYKMKKESSVPQVKADTAKVMDMFLKRRSKSLNDAVLAREYFERERKKKRPQRSTIPVTRTTRTDQSSQIVEKMEVETMEKTIERRPESGRRPKSPATTKIRAHASYVLAMEHPVNEYSATEQAADDELSSPEEEKSRSAPSTLRMQVTKVNNDELLNLRHIENGSVTLTRDRRERKEIKRKKSLLDKAKRIIRSPSTQRKHIVEDHKPYSNSIAKDEVHHEMKKTGFTSKLRRTFSRKENRKPKESASSKGHCAMDVQGSFERVDETKEKHSKIWPFKRRSKKSASTPTDESAAGASDTASMRDWQSSSSISSATHSLNVTERRKLLIDIRRGVHLRRSGHFSDSGIIDSSGPPQFRMPRPHSLHQERIGDSTGSLASSEGSDRKPDRPTSLIFRERRAERQRRGLNDVVNLESTTPGLIRRDTDTRQLVFSMSLSLASDIESDGLTDDRSQSKEEDKDNEARGDERRYSRASLASSWTSSTWEEMSGASGSDIPFEQRPPDEQEDFFKRIADRLAQIGDQVLQDYEIGASADLPPPLPPKQKHLRGQGHRPVQAMASSSSADAAMGTNADLQEAIGNRIQSTVDGITRNSQRRFPLEFVKRVIVDTAYSTFRETVHSLISTYPNMEQLSQLALVFYFTKQACKVAHSVGTRASAIKENSILFIGDRFASWIDSQGGWGGVLDSDDSDDSVHESEID